MKDRHLTARVPAELDRALARWAERRGVPKSQLVREAVARLLAPPAAPVPAVQVPARVLAGRWAAVPHLTPEEAGALEADIAVARSKLPRVRAPWA
jgi:Ribbon-helix-helix protein, copG family